MGWNSKYDYSSTVSSSDTSIYPAMPPPPPSGQKHYPEKSLPEGHGHHVQSKKQNNRTFRDDSDHEDGGQGIRRRRRPRRLICCAWTLLILFAVSLGLLILGLIFVLTLKSGLPEVRIVQMDFPTLNTDNSKPDTKLNATVQTQIRVYNKNSDVGIHYSRCRVVVSSENVPLGEAKVGEFSQKANETTILNVDTDVKNSVVNEDDAAEMMSNATINQMVVDVVMSGTIGYRLGDVIRINWIPFLVVCKDIRVNAIPSPNPLCNVKILVSGFTF